MTKILVVDDERDIKGLLSDALSGAGYGITEAKDVGSALEKTYRQHPDIIILDEMMPVMDGFQVLEKLKNN